MKSNLMRVLIIADEHVTSDEEDHDAYRLVLQFAKDYQPDAVVNLGDLLSWNVISAYNKQKLRKVERGRIKAEYEAGNKRLDQVQKATNYAHYTLLEGNHDRWIEEWVDATPAVEGLVEMPHMLSLASREIDWVTLDNQPYKLGKVNLLHGWWSGVNAPKKHVDKLGGNVIHGHVHKTGTYYRNVYDANDMQVGHSVGCLTTTRPPYQRAPVTDHNNGFGLLYVDPEDGMFSFNNIAMIRNNFIVGPNRYSLKELANGRLEKELA